MHPSNIAIYGMLPLVLYSCICLLLYKSPNVAGTNPIGYDCAEGPWEKFDDIPAPNDSVLNVAFGKAYYELPLDSSFNNIADFPPP